MWRCWLLSRRTKPSWYSTSLHWASELKIPHILSGRNENSFFFFKAFVEEGVDDENFWGQQQVPASWLNLHVLMMSARRCMAPHHWQKLSTATTYNLLASDGFLSAVFVLARSHKATELKQLCIQIVSFHVVAFSIFLVYFLLFWCYITKVLHRFEYYLFYCVVFDLSIHLSIKVVFE